jgi:hypothetical protein
MRRFLVPVLLASVLLAACFGPFRATRGVWKFNDDISSNKFVDELVFLAMVIIPVYELASLGDAIIFNSIEFWTGTNPFAGGEASVATPPGDGATVAVERGDDGALTLRRGDVTVRIVADEDGLRAFDAAGNVVATAHRVDGALVIADRDGTRTIGPAALARVATGGPAAALALAAENAVCRAP